jgi:hypothetical protein
MHRHPATTFCRGVADTAEGWEVRPELPEERDLGVANGVMLLTIANLDANSSPDG